MVSHFSPAQTTGTRSRIENETNSVCYEGRLLWRGDSSNIVYITTDKLREKRIVGSIITIRGFEPPYLVL